MVEARSDDEAVKVLTECGYEELPALTNRGLDELLSAARAALYRELGGAVPDKRLVELFQMKYDYHNAKALVKGAAVGADADRLLMEGGRWSAAQVKEAFQRDSLREFTDPFRRAVVQARRPSMVEMTLNWPTLCWTGPILRRWRRRPARWAAPSWRVCAAAHRRRQPALRRPVRPDGEGERLLSQVLLPGKCGGPRAHVRQGQ